MLLRGIIGERERWLSMEECGGGEWRGVVRLSMAVYACVIWERRGDATGKIVLAMVAMRVWDGWLYSGRRMAAMRFGGLGARAG